MTGFFNKEDIHTTKKIGSTSRLSCFTCGLYKDVRSPKMEPYGNFKKRIMVIGDAPSDRDDASGKPFQGKAGQLLERALEKAGVDLFEDCIVLNAVNCKPPDDKSPTGSAINCCREVKVLKAIEAYKPLLILVLGNEALTSLIGPKMKGKLGGIMKWAGRQIPDQDYKTWICPTFHPSFVEKATDNIKKGFGETGLEISVVWENDIKKAIEFLDKPFPEYKEPKIKFIDDLEYLRTIVTDMAAFDYETTGIKPHKVGHRIVCASIAYRKKKIKGKPIEVLAFMMPSKKSEREAFIEFLHSQIKKVASNLKFEDNWTHERLKTYVNNWYHDTMLTAHIIDHRPGTTGLKYQTYIHFGVVGYDDEVSHYLGSSDDKSNSINRIYKLLDKPNGKEQLLRYCGLDSYFELLLAELQIPLLHELIERP